MWGRNLSLRKKLQVCEFPSDCGLQCWRWVCGETGSQPLLHASTWPFSSLLMWRIGWGSFQVFFRGNCSRHSCRRGVSIEGGALRILCCHLILPLQLWLVVLFFFFYRQYLFCIRIPNWLFRKATNVCIKLTTLLKALIANSFSVDSLEFSRNTTSLVSNNIWVLPSRIYYYLFSCLPVLTHPEKSYTVNEHYRCLCHSRPYLLYVFHY